VKKAALDELAERVENIYDQRNQSREARLEKRNFFSQYKTTDPLYLENHLEPLILLSDEIKTLSSLLKHPAFCMSTEAQKRLHFLKGSQNRIVLQEENVRRSTKIKEAQVFFLHPVEVCENDLETILSLIEGVAIQKAVPQGRPQLIIQNLEMKKKQKAEEKETFILQLQLLKREFL
jgi:hypothetical protein